MKKPAIILLLAVILLTSLVLGAYAYAGEYTNIEFNPDNGIWLEDTLEITNEDIETGFADYAESGSRVSFGAELTPSSVVKRSDVVGVVTDKYTNEVIENANIYINDIFLVTTGSDGRFQIDNLPMGEYKWEVKAEGYELYQLTNFTTYDKEIFGATIFTFQLDGNHAVYRDWSKNIKTDDAGLTKNLKIHRGVSKSFSTTPQAKKDFVLYRCNLGSKGYTYTETVNRQNYIAKVVCSELSGSEAYITQGKMTRNQVLQWYIAQAIASNTYLEYALTVSHNHNNVAICDGYSGTNGSGSYEPTGCCQFYNDIASNGLAVDAAKAIFMRISGVDTTTILFYNPSGASYDYMLGAFFSSCGSRGTLDYPSSYSYQPALRSVSCSDFAPGYGGHRYGLCQMGAAQMAKQGTPAIQILEHYYTDVTHIFCTLY